MEGSSSIPPPTQDQTPAAPTPSTGWYNWWAREATEGEETPPPEAPYLLSPSWGLNLISHIRALIWSDAYAQQGYDQHQDGIFKMPFIGQWVTVPTGKYIDEVLHAPDSVLSFQAVLNDQIQLDHLVGPALSENQIHLPLIRTLNRNLDALYPEIVDETEFAFKEALEKAKEEEDGWASIKAFKLVTEVILSLHHRALVGLPLCRDKEWRKGMEKDSREVGLRSIALRLFPRSRRGDANHYISWFGEPFRYSEKRVADALEERLATTPGERPNDMLTWILNKLPEDERTPRVVCGIFELILMVAQGTTSMSFGHALYHLVANPEYMDALRQEIDETRGDEEELTREMLEGMPKLDSFLRETQRLSGLGKFTIVRMAVKDFTFSNGVRVPAGDTIQILGGPIHHDEQYYKDALEFKPWRYYDLKQEAEAPTTQATAGAEDAEVPVLSAVEGEAGEPGGKRKLKPKYDMVEPSKTHLTWGLGRHACPGRWYAAMVMKHLMVYLLINYDLKLPEKAKGKRPADLNILGSSIPNMSAQILLKKREQE